MEHSNQLRFLNNKNLPLKKQLTITKKASHWEAFDILSNADVIPTLLQDSLSELLVSVRT